VWGGIDIKRPSARSSPYIGQVIPLLLLNQESGVMGAATLQFDVRVVGNAVVLVGR
jgi:hypothetical protein